MTKKQLLWTIFLIALAMMLGSLYIENFGDPIKNLLMGVLFPSASGFPPCTLCWYERICMYPIVAIAVMHLLRGAKDPEKYMLPFVVIGIGFCAYHALLQRGIIPAPSICTTNAPCDYPVINYFGWMNLPFFGLICNGLIVFLINKLVRK